MKILIDMNLSPLWVLFLEQKGFEAVHWSSLGPVAAPDSEIMKHAADHGYVVLTHDLDFGRILALERSSAPSVMQIRTQDVLPSIIGGLVVDALRAAKSHLKSGALVTVDPNQHRIRLLPI